MEPLTQAGPAEVIQPNRAAAIWFNLPFLLLGFIVVAWSTLLYFSPPAPCGKLFDISLSAWSLFYLAYILAPMVAICMLWLGYIGFQSVRQGCYPPRNLPVFRKTQIKVGLFARVKGYVALIAPLGGIYLVYLGHISWSEVAQGRTLEELSASVLKSCL